MSNAQDLMAEHERQMAALAEKYIGNIDGKNHPDPWFRKRWFINRIKELGVAEGRNDARMRRCKRTDSLTYQRYQQIETELQLLADHLALELLEL